MINAKNIGIIGLGFVGGSVKGWYGDDAYGYSLTEGKFEELDKREYIFLCLPTPYLKGAGFNLSILHENIEKLTGSKKIIIKSTILPNSTQNLQSIYPQHTFFFNPEFLTARRAKFEFLHPPRQIVGHLGEKEIAQEILESLPSAPMSKICGAKEAEMLKLIANCYLATRVVFANDMYDYCKKVGVDYKDTIEMVTGGDPRIEPSHWDIFHEGYRGYSGYCFPKDMGAVIEDSDSELLRKAHEINDKLREE